MDFKLEHAVEVLSRTPGVFRTLLQGLSEPWISNNEGADTWSPYDVVGHLIHGEKCDWIERSKIILEHGTAKPFAPFDRFAMFEKSKGKTMDDLLDEFETARKKNMEELKNLWLQPDRFDLQGTHPDFGTVTLGQLLATWAAHDLSHIGQIVRVMAKQYKEAVGPWGKYVRPLRE